MQFKVERDSEMVDQLVHVQSPLLVMPVEIFQAILDYIYPIKSNRQSLVALALTCRVLSEPSLDRLWKKLPSLEPLIRSYTNDVENLVSPSLLAFISYSMLACTDPPHPLPIRCH